MAQPASPPPAVRLVQFDDLPEVCRISNWAALHTAANFAVEPESLEQWRVDWEATHRQFPWLVATRDGAIVGFAKAGPHKGRCAYRWTAETTVYVDPHHHGSGVGRALYGALIPILRDQGYRTLLAGITIPNPASVRLHESFGFRPAGLFARVGWKFDRYHDVSYWQAVLDDSTSPPAAIRPVAEVYHTPSPVSP